MISDFTPVDISQWLPDNETYPEGSLVKSTWFAPSVLEDSRILPNHRYLFKHSKAGRPAQFWSEIVAYILGCLIDVPVPKALPAFRANHPDVPLLEGVLIEWFYEPNDIYIPAESLFVKVLENFDTKKGEKHNLETAILLCEAIDDVEKFESNTKLILSLYKVFLLDSLTGNTDRHQLSI